MTTDVEQLVAEGRLQEAADRLEGEGQPGRAVELYEQLWDFKSAARAARAAGDFPRAIRNMLQVREPGGLEPLVAEIRRANPDTAARCAMACEERSAWPVAATLYEAAGDLASAARCHEQAGALVDAARLNEQLGQLKPAMALYRRHLDELDQAESAPGIAAGPAYQLGRLLLRFGRPAEALPLLQRARDTADDEQTVAHAGKAAVAALARLGYHDGAGVALELLRARAPRLCPEVESVSDCIEAPELAPVQDGEEKVLAGRYQLGELLGSGGMGRVYAANDRLTDHRVAVKVFTAPGGARGRDAYRRFLREARTTGQLQHPHIVNLLDFHEEMGFMVLEYMEGGTLAQRLRPRLDLATCRSVTLQVISGLAAAHQRGIVHRDIKPSNIFFTAAGAAKLGDFGVAHLQDAGQTQTGAFIGTLAFMSPEQIKGDPVTFATDLYALGVTLFRMLTGQLPFSPPDLVTKHLTSPAPPPSSLVADLPPVCDEAVLRCLAKDPAERFESLAALQQVVERFPADQDVVQPAATPAPAAQPQQRRSTDTRFHVESTVLSRGPLEILGAQDTRLGRPVLLLRAAPGATRERLFELLVVAARAGGDTLQRVLGIDADRGQALLEVPVGEHPDLPPRSPAAALRMAEQMGQALAPLHAAGLTHGRIARDQLWQMGRSTTLGLTGALAARVDDAHLPGPADEVAASCLLLGLTSASPFADGAALASWARDERQRVEQDELDSRRQQLLRQALQDAPPEVPRKV